MMSVLGAWLIFNAGVFVGVALVAFLSANAPR
jgi:hypothetical protein